MGQSIIIVPWTTSVHGGYGMRPIFLKIEEAAAELRVSRAKAYELVKNGSIPSIQVGGILRVPRAALLAMAGEVTGGETERKSA